MRGCALAAMAIPLMTFAATPRLDDYARGVDVDIGTGGRPIVQLDVPDVVYRTVVTNDLSDVRVFNVQGVPVPHALCVAPTAQAPTITQISLPVYRLQDVPRTTSEGTRVEVRTPSGAQISVDGNTAGTSERQTSAYVIDARGVDDELRAVQFDWSSPDGASEARVSIQASDDLDRWRTLVAGTTLLQVPGDPPLRRHRVGIPQAEYDYLRVQRVDRGPPLQLDAVIAESVTPAPLREPAWFTTNAASTAASNAIEFDAARRAPIAYARLAPTQENTSLHIAIDSRADSQAAWTTRWTGEVYAIFTDAEQRVSAPAQFAPTTHAHWRVRLTQASETFHRAPMLELGYRPARLRFLAQGAGPYTLAFGSRRAEPTPSRECDELLGALSPAELEQNLGDGYAGAQRALGGEDALRPLPRKTPLRQMVLWGVLVVGVVILIAMALSLLRRIKPPGKY
jgi:hypothetical protein